MERPLFFAWRILFRTSRGTMRQFRVLTIRLLVFTRWRSHPDPWPTGGFCAMRTFFRINLALVENPIRFRQPGFGCPIQTLVIPSTSEN